MMQFIVLIAAILLLVASLYLHQKQRSFRQITSKMPTLYGIPFIGIAYEFINLSKFYERVSIGFDELQCLTGCIWVATTPVIVTVDPEIIKNVTSSPDFLNKSRDLYSHFHNGILNGIIVSPVKKWRADRKIISPFLSHSNIMSFFPLFNGNAKRVKQKLTNVVGCGEQNVLDILKAFGLQLSILTIMGLKMDEGSEEYNKMMDSFNILVNSMAKNSVYSAVGLSFLTETPLYRKTKKYVRGVVRSLIKENMNKLAESDKLEEYEESNQTLINLALKAMHQGQFTSTDVEIECFTMIAASYETSAIAVFSTLVMLSMHPEVQERVFEEIKSVFPDKVTSVEYDDLKKFPYLDMVIAESLRLAPPIPYIGREAVNEAKIRADITVPKNMQIVIPIYELHRRPEVWGPESKRFNPDNFLPEKIAKRPPCAYMAFSKGMRSCVGFRYADISMRVLLISVLRNLKFSTTFKFEDLVFMPRVTLSYKDEPKLSIELRNN
ncbi:probable cytochrome P450 313a4 [Eurosta solidaginis]|uniref:probable cytochrome P450 313a4 n=1 Tax=Eurosta solidaginis TaxID=178769 RepID=UPI00353110F0